MKALIKNSQGIFLKDKSIEHVHDVLLKVDMVGLCRTDLLVAQGKISINQEEIILGHEFSAIVVDDKTKQLSTGQKVGVNPLWLQKFMGLDFDGALCEYISVPFDKVIPTSCDDARLVAYLEPTAASMAVLKALGHQDEKIAIVGKNRIAYLTLLILQSYGYQVDYLDVGEQFKENHYDTMIETVFEEDVIKKIVSSLKEGGTLVVKSRKKFPVSITASDLVSKEITLKSVNYYDFTQAMRWLENNKDVVKDLLGEVYNIENWEQAFIAAQSGEQKKIFIKI